MNRISTRILQVVIVLMGVVALVALLWEPHLEGRNAHATLFEIYFKDPFLAYAYIASIPFFVGLHQAFKLTGKIGQGEPFSQGSVKALRVIKKCGMWIIAFAAVGIFWILLSESDDGAGGVFMGGVIAFSSLVVTVLAAVFEKRLSKMV